MTLYDYQRECVEAVASSARNGVTRQLVTLPTGCGKTVVFAHLPAALGAKRTLVIAHREELIDQAAATLAKANPGASIGVEMAERSASPTDSIVVASVQSLATRLERYACGSFALVICDEAHHAVAASYRKVFSHLGVMDDRRDQWPNHLTGRVLVGFTATAGRGDGQGLGQVFQKIVFSRTLREMIEAGWLVDIAGWRIRTDASLSSVRTVAGDFATGSLSRAVNTKARNALVVDSWLRLAKGVKTLAFATDVQHAADLAAAFRARGIKAESVDGSMAKAQRRATVKSFEVGRLDVLTNCNLLTEGFDVPDIGAVLMARPTKSRGLYVQMLGRGTRTAPDKEILKLIDFVDNTRRNDVVSLPSLFGLNPELNCQGRKVADLAERVESSGIEGHAFVDAAKLEATIERINLFRVPDLPAEIACMTTFAWSPVLEGIYRLPLPERRALVIVENLLGRFDVIAENHGERRQIAEFTDIADALFNADKLVPRECVGAVMRGARWRSEPPTDRQRATAAKLGIVLPRDVTKGSASAMISAYFARGERWTQSEMAAVRG